MAATPLQNTMHRLCTDLEWELQLKLKPNCNLFSSNNNTLQLSNLQLLVNSDSPERLM